LNAQIPISASDYGFVTSPGGTHTSRTMMLSELQLLLATCSATASYEIYSTAILEENVLLKKTASTQRRSLRGLRELYGLQRDLLIFRALRDVWEENTEAQPLLALLCALARDSVFRATAARMLTTSPGDTVDADIMATTVGTAFPNNYNPNTLGKIGRNTASSWSQSGHLHGRSQKVRVEVKPYPINVTYALFLGFLCEQRGEALFQTLWCRLLDVSIYELHSLAQVASQRGWLEYRHTGGVTEITFDHLLREEPGE